MTEERARYDISWTGVNDAEADNEKQVARLIDSLLATAAELEQDADDAIPQRQQMNPDATKGRLGMIYVDERTRVNRALARELRETAARLEAIQ